MASSLAIDTGRPQPEDKTERVTSGEHGHRWWAVAKWLLPVGRLIERQPRDESSSLRTVRLQAVPAALAVSGRGCPPAAPPSPAQTGVTPPELSTSITADFTTSTDRPPCLTTIRSRTVTRA